MIFTLDVVVSMLLIAAKDIANLMQYDLSISNQKWSSVKSKIFELELLLGARVLMQN